MSTYSNETTPTNAGKGKDHQMPPNKNPRLNDSQSAHKTPVVSSPDKANRKVPNQTTQSQGSPPQRPSAADSDEDMQHETEDEESNTERAPGNPRRKATYNPANDPENVSMHAQREVDDVFTVGTQVLVPATPDEDTAPKPGARIPSPTAPVNSDDEQETRRPNTRTISFANRSAMPALTLIRVDSFDEERDRIVFGTGENPHGRIEEPEAFYSAGEKLILQHCSANEGHFIKALFYPSYIFQGVTPDRVERYCKPDSGFLALVFFNGGNALHTKYRKTVSDLTEFLVQIGCRAEDIQINAPFYQRPRVEESDNSQQSTSRNGSSKGKPKTKVNLGGLSPVGHPKENDKYKGPNTAFVKIESASLRRKLLRFQTIAVSKTLTFHVITPSIIYRPWIVCTMFANTLKTSDYVRDGIRWAIQKAIRDDPTLVNTIAECSGNMGTAQQRVQSYIDTIEVCNAHYTALKEGQVCSAWLIYAMPNPKDGTYLEMDAREQKIHTMVSKLRLQFEDIDIWGEVIECTRCKLLDHQTYQCIFETGTAWKGPTEGISEVLKELQNAKKKTG
ncbi:hypothetical protein C8R42DRAFT_726456 [Lentinula raphanica]|nr:hypothetical protein C8R42DRAFT_726456 [Lentinula raphanica]